MTYESLVDVIVGSDHGPQTNDELDFRVGTASRRTAELVQVGRLVRSDESRVTRTGRQALVLRLPPCANG